MGTASSLTVSSPSFQEKIEDLEASMDGMESPGSHSIINMDVDTKAADEDRVLAPSSSADTSPTSSFVHLHGAHIYTSTGANGFGKIASKIPGFGQPNGLKERSTNLLPSGPARSR